MKKRFREQKNRIKAILQQRDGATIVFALVVFMIAAIASATIVSVAMANLTRTAGRKSYEQARIAVMSAAKYLESDDTNLNAALEAMPLAGATWTVNVSGDSDANEVLQSKIEWKDIDPGAAMTAIITSDGTGSSGSYAAQIRLVKDAGKWRISKFMKKTGTS